MSTATTTARPARTAGTAARDASTAGTANTSRTAAPVDAVPAGPRRAPFVALVLGLIGAGLCALLAINTAAAADEVRQRDLAAANANTGDLTQQLQIDIANKQAPAALASAARALGMVPNPNPAFLILAPDGSAKVVGSPAKATGPAVPTPTATVTPTTTPTATPTPTTTPTPTGTPSAPATPTPGSPSPTTVNIQGTR